MASSSSPTTGFCYENPSTLQSSHLLNQIQGVNEPNQADQIINMDTRSIHNHHSLTVNRPWQDQRSSFSSVFPCEANERPSHGLSLSLSSTNPSGIELRPFELRHMASNYQQEQQVLQDGGLLKAMNLNKKSPALLRSSKFLCPLQDLLSEFCNLDGSTKQMNNRDKNQRWEIDERGSSSSSIKQSLSSIEFMEFQNRKTKLLFILNEVDRRYRCYRDQMKVVVSSFEAVAGDGAAKVYTALASKAMSRHFKCIRDAIVSQIHAIKRTIGDNDTVAIGRTKGETPKLRIIDQALRRQKALLRHMNVMEPQPWQSQRGLPEKSISILRAWLFEHFLNPYPNDVDKHILSRQTGLSRTQVSNWFINARVRLWKPMVEEMYLEETKDQQQELDDDAIINGGRLNQNNTNPSTEQKPTPNQLMHVECDNGLSSLITSNKALDQDYSLQFGSFGGGVGLDFGGGGSSGVDNEVSLTLGLKQIDDEFSLVDGDDQNLGDYKDLMGDQLLRDLAG